MWPEVLLDADGDGHDANVQAEAAKPQAAQQTLEIGPIPHLSTPRRLGAHSWDHLCTRAWNPLNLEEVRISSNGRGASLCRT